MITSPDQLSPSTRCPANWLIVSGSSSSDDAKIGGIKLAVLSLSGRWLRLACIPRWVARLGYWIRVRRWAKSMLQMNSVRPSTAATLRIRLRGLSATLRPPRRGLAHDGVTVWASPAQMNSDTPERENGEWR